MSDVLAKFLVMECTECSIYNKAGMVAGTRVKLSAVQDAVFGDYTPQGDISMTIVGDAAAVFVDAFRAALHATPMGRAEFYVRFSPVAEGKTPLPDAPGETS